MKVKSYSQAFNFQRKAEKSLGNTKMAAIKFDVNRNNRDLKHRLRNGTTTPTGSEIFPREPSRHA